MHFQVGIRRRIHLDPALYQFLLAATNGQLLTDSPVNLQDGLTHNINISYIMPVGEKLSLTPSFTYSNMMYAEGSNTLADRIKPTMPVSMLLIP